MLSGALCWFGGTVLFPRAHCVSLSVRVSVASMCIFLCVSVSECVVPVCVSQWCPRLFFCVVCLCVCLSIFLSGLLSSLQSSWVGILVLGLMSRI